jgi:beta-glucosidase
VRFTLHPDDLALLDKNMKWTVEPGGFEVQVGSSSVDIRLKKDFTILNPPKASGEFRAPERSN